MSDSEQEQAPAAATKSVATTSKKAKNATSAPAGTKLEDYRSLAEDHMDELALLVYDYMLLKSMEQASYIKQENIFVPNADGVITFGADWEAPEGSDPEKKWTVTEKIESTMKQLKASMPKHLSAEGKVAYMAWRMGAYALVDMGHGKKQFFIMGYLLAPVSENPLAFHPFSSKQLPVFHPPTPNKLAHFKDDEHALHELTDSEADTEFDFPEFDFRFYIQKWMESQRAILRKTTVTTKEEEEEEEEVSIVTPTASSNNDNKKDVKEKKEKKKKAASPTAQVSALLEEGYQRRPQVAVRELTKLIKASDPNTRVAMTGPIQDPPLLITDEKRLGYFPDDFHVDLDYFLNAKHITAKQWKTKQVAQAILISAVGDHYVMQGPLLFSQEKGMPLRNDTIPNMINAWENRSSDGQWDRAVFAGGMKVAGDFIKSLAMEDSPLLKRSMPFRMAAELTSRVARVREVHSTRAFPGVLCALTGEPIAEGTPCDAYDLVLRKAYLTPDIPETLTLLVKQTSNGTCKIFPLKAGSVAKSPARPKSPGAASSPKKPTIKESSPKKVKQPRPSEKKTTKEEEEEEEPVKQKKRKTPEADTASNMTQELVVETQPKPKKSRKAESSSNEFVPGPVFINRWPNNLVVHGTQIWQAFAHVSPSVNLKDENYQRFLELVQAKNNAEIKQLIPKTQQEVLWSLFDVLLEFVKPGDSLEEKKKPAEDDINAMDFLDVLDLAGTVSETPKFVERNDLPIPAFGALTLHTIASSAIKQGKRPSTMSLLSETYKNPENVLSGMFHPLHHMAFAALFSHRKV